jgi:hypothetical protein
MHSHAFLDARLVVGSNSCRGVHHSCTNDCVIKSLILPRFSELVFIPESTLGYKQTPYAQKMPWCQDNCDIIIHVHQLILFARQATPPTVPYYARTWSDFVVAV